MRVKKNATIAILLLSLSGILALSQPFRVFKDDNPIFVPPKEIKYFHFGFQYMIADLLWLRLMQDFDYCGQGTVKASNVGEQLDDILGNEMAPSQCTKGWVFHMLDLITELSPHFQHAYFRGGQMLSIVVDDRDGAKIIFDRGVRRFPEDWQLAYAAAYHYLYELQIPRGAARLLIQAHEHGGPEWLPVLAGRLYDQAGSAEFAIIVLLDFIAKKPKDYALKRAKERIREIAKTANISEELRIKVKALDETL